MTPERPDTPRQEQVYLTSPVWLSAGDGHAPGMGFGTGLQFGWDHGFFMPEIHLGLQTSAVGDDHVLGPEAPRRLTNSYLGAGVRFQLLNSSRWIPFISVGVRLQGFWWAETFEDTQGHSLYLGVVGGAGFTIELARNVGFELAVDVVSTIPLGSQILTSVQLQAIPRLGWVFFL